MTLIEIDGVGVTYNGGAGQPVKALRSIDLSVPEGELLCLIGPSGCGKTTLLNVIAGFASPTAGQVRFAGRVVGGPGPDRAMVFQDAALFPWLPVTGNIDFVLRMQRVPQSERREIGAQMISLVGLDGFEHAHPHELSGGMAQRVALARALAMRPRVLLMDEPFGALDAQTRGRLQDELLHIHSETSTTIVFVTHNVEEAAYMGDRVAVLSERPACVTELVSVHLPRPRHRLDPALYDLRARLLRALPASEADPARGNSATPITPRG